MALLRCAAACAAGGAHAAPSWNMAPRHAALTAALSARAPPRVDRANFLVVAASRPPDVDCILPRCLPLAVPHRALDHRWSRPQFASQFPAYQAI